MIPHNSVVYITEDECINSYIIRDSVEILRNHIYFELHVLIRIADRFKDIGTIAMIAISGEYREIFQLRVLRDNVPTYARY